MGDNTGIDTAFKEWADIRAFELHEHEASAARMATVGAVFGLDAPSEEETNAEIEAFLSHVDATAEALIEAYRRGLVAGRTLDGRTHDEFPEVRG